MSSGRRWLDSRGRSVWEVGFGVDLERNITRYLYGGGGSEGRVADARYASFDFCFNYYQSFRGAGNSAALASNENLQRSCLELGFYLASWGMLRGSAALLQRSVRSLVPVVERIAEAPSAVWLIDANSYSPSNIDLLLETASAIRRANGGMSDILVTKVMLGVFGNVPAFDTYFKRGAGVSTFGAKALRKVGEFYSENAEVIDSFMVPTLDFSTGEPTTRRYTRAKVIDMAFFIEGMG